MTLSVSISQDVTITTLNSLDPGTMMLRNVRYDRRPWDTGPRPSCFTGTRISWKRNLMEGGVHRGQGQYYWQEGRDSHLTPP